jgi:hypothetical protein
MKEKEYIELSDKVLDLYYKCMLDGSIDKETASKILRALNYITEASEVCKVMRYEVLNNYGERIKKLNLFNVPF